MAASRGFTRCRTGTAESQGTRPTVHETMVLGREGFRTLESLGSPLVRILAIDGGGIRGLIPAIVLADLERRTGRRTAELFDLIAGTSTGGILACGLTRPGDGDAPAFSAADLIGLYESEGPEIFHRPCCGRIASVGGLTDERYDDRGLTAALARYLDGAGCRRPRPTSSSRPTRSSGARRSSSARRAPARTPATTSRWSTSPVPPRPRPRTSSPCASPPPAGATATRSSTAGCSPSTRR